MTADESASPPRQHQYYCKPKYSAGLLAWPLRSVLVLMATGYYNTKGILTHRFLLIPASPDVSESLSVSVSQSDIGCLLGESRKWADCDCDPDTDSDSDVLRSAPVRGEIEKSLDTIGASY